MRNPSETAREPFGVSSWIAVRSCPCSHHTRPGGADNCYRYPVSHSPPSISVEVSGDMAANNSGKRNRRGTDRRPSADTGTWTARRARWAERLPYPCARCGEVINPGDLWDLDHLTPKATGGADDTARPSHVRCNRRHGGLMREAMRRGVASLDEIAGRGPVFLPAPPAGPAPAGAYTPPSHSAMQGRIDPDDDEPAVVTPPPDSDAWGVPWLDSLRDLPPEATWPRLMTAPHPLAVGSYGADAVAWARDTWGIEARWWQRLALARLLEHDESGGLLWADGLVTTARQVGKSWLLRILAGWRMHEHALGPSPVVLHTGKDLGVCREVQRPARAWARNEPGYVVRDANGQEEITGPGGGRWIIRGRNSVYGYSAALALVDEAWWLTPAIVDDGLEPTLTEQPNAQLLLFSTAHRLATPLVLLRRAALMAGLIPDEDAGSLLLEWSAKPGSDVSNPEAWRLASPHWSKGRERLILKRIARMDKGISDDPDEDDPVASFRAQFLNRWPLKTLITSGRDEPLTDADSWSRAGDLRASAPAEGPITVAVEDFYGLGCAAAAAARLRDGRTLVWGEVFGARPDAFAWAAHTFGAREGCTLLVGASLPRKAIAEALEGVTTDGAGAAQTRAGLPLLRSLIASGGLVHSGGDALTGQIVGLRVVPSGVGGLLPAPGSTRHDLARAAAWAAAHVADPDTAPQPFYVY